MLYNKHDRPVIFLLMAIIADVVITVPHWQMEANPVVIALGRESFVFVKFALIVGVSFAWWIANAKESIVGRVVAWSGGWFHALVVFLNLLALHGLVS